VEPAEEAVQHLPSFAPRRGDSVEEPAHRSTPTEVVAVQAETSGVIGGRAAFMSDH